MQLVYGFVKIPCILNFFSCVGVRRRFSPWASFALAGGGFLIGSQMGLVSGALAGVRTIKTLPNSEHLMGLVRDVQ